MKASKKEFVAIIQEHQGIIRSLCGIYFQNTEDQKDIRQEIILQLWKALSTFKGESKISTWIYKVSINTILNYKRKLKKYPINESLEKVPHKSMPCQAVDDDIILLRQIINTLKDHDKAIIILCLEGYKNKEIAEILHLSATNVGTKLHRIKAELKEKFKINDHVSR